MNLIFKSIKWKNFLSTGNDFTEINLNSYKSTLIVGENGCGKCLHPSTQISVQAKTEEIDEIFKNFMKNRS